MLFAEIPYSSDSGKKKLSDVVPRQIVPCEIHHRALASITSGVYRWRSAAPVDWVAVMKFKTMKINSESFLRLFHEN